MAATILIADDDSKLLRMLRRTLIYEGLNVVTAGNGREAMEAIETHRPDAVILDWMMPEMDGVDVAGHLRSQGNQVPILMLTARDAIEDRVEGLESGADDYLVKPFAPAELVARVHALLRRAGTNQGDESLTYSDLVLDPVTREARRGSRAFDLTRTEYDLLHYLISNPRRVLTRDQILSQVWDYDFAGDDNVLDVYIGYVRRKTEAGGEPRLIQTVRGVGYVLREE